MSTNEIDFLSVLASFAEKIDNDPDKNKQDTVVYMIENPKTQQYYFGATTQRKARRDKHIQKLEAETHVNKRFQEAYQQDPSFVWKELRVSNPQTAFDIERALIKECRDDPKCLNIKGGSGYDEEKYKKVAIANTGKQHSDLTKERLKQTSTAYWSDQSNRNRQSEVRKQHFANGAIPYQLGLKRDEDYCSKVSEGRKAYWKSLTEEERNNLNVKRAQGMQKPVIVGDKTYLSRKDAAIGEGISPPSVKDRIESQNFPDWKWGKC